MRPNPGRRALVVLEPEMLRDGVEQALAVGGGFETMPPEMCDAIRETPKRKLLLHPSARPDVVIAGSDLAAELAAIGFTVVEVPAVADSPVIAYAHGAEVARVAASLRGVVELAQTLAGVRRAATS
jgi:hypothetical protein